MTRRDFARRCFWSTHPLCQMCALAYGYWDGNVYHRTGSFSLKQMIEFTEALPVDAFLRVSGQHREAA